MGIFRDVFSIMGLCDERTTQERKEDVTWEKQYAESVTHHTRGCDCCWCKCARLGANLDHH